jgi:hypothetical protein
LAEPSFEYYFTQLSPAGYKLNGSDPETQCSSKKIRGASARYDGEQRVNVNELGDSVGLSI